MHRTRLGLEQGGWTPKSEKWDSLVPNISEQEEKGRHGRMKLEPGGEVCVVGWGAGGRKNGGRVGGRMTGTEVGGRITGDGVGGRITGEVGLVDGGRVGNGTGMNVTAGADGVWVVCSEVLPTIHRTFPKYLKFTVKLMFKGIQFTMVPFKLL